MDAAQFGLKFAFCELFSPGKTNSIVVDYRLGPERMRTRGTEPSVAKITSEEGWGTKPGQNSSDREKAGSETH